MKNNKIKNNFFIYSSNEQKNLFLIKSIKKMMVDNHFFYSKKNPQYVFILGGDGTFVKTIRSFFNKKVSIICINTGNIGFYSMFDKNRLPKIKEILNEKNYITPDVIEAKINSKKIYAINEIVLQSLNIISFDIYINKKFYESYKGSGILVSTKTGSTGYCKSAHGSIIFPQVDAFEMVEISPTLHAKKNTVVSPVILDTKASIIFSKINSNSQSIILADGIKNNNIKNNSNLDLKIIKPNFKLFFINNNEDYIKKLQKTFIKG